MSLLCHWGECANSEWSSDTRKDAFSDRTPLLCLCLILYSNFNLKPYSTPPALTATTKAYTLSLYYSMWVRDKIPCSVFLQFIRHKLCSYGIHIGPFSFVTVIKRLNKNSHLEDAVVKDPTYCCCWSGKPTTCRHRCGKNIQFRLNGTDVCRDAGVACSR